MIYERAQSGRSWGWCVRTRSPPVLLHLPSFVITDEAAQASHQELLELIN